MPSKDAATVPVQVKVRGRWRILLANHLIRGVRFRWRISGQAWRPWTKLALPLIDPTTGEQVAREHVLDVDQTLFDQDEWGVPS